MPKNDNGTWANLLTFLMSWLVGDPFKTTSNSDQLLWSNTHFLRTIISVLSIVPVTFPTTPYKFGKDKSYEYK